MKKMVVVLLAACGHPGAGSQTCDLSNPCGDETLTTSWTLMSRGFEFGCAAFVEPSVEISIGEYTQEVACSDAVAVSKVAEDRYTIRGAMTSNGEEFRTATTQVTVRGSTNAELVFKFDDFALGGEFADSFEAAFCARCTTDTFTCGEAVRGWACGDAGTCDLPTLGTTTELGQCRAQLQTMACDSQTIPQACGPFRVVLPGLVR
jgi:hypothetical protein